MTEQHNNQNPIVINTAPAQQEPNNDTIDLTEYLGIIIDAKKMIAVIVAIGLVISINICILATPQFQADALVQVESKQGAGLSGLEDVASLFEGDNSVDTEIELIQSRMVLGEAVRRQAIDIIAQPKQFPVIGEAFSRRFERNAPKNTIAKPFLGLSSYGWGGEKITTDVFDVPDSYLNQPMTLVVGQSGKYTLWYEETQLLDGRVGQLAQKVFTEKNNDSDAATKEVLQLHIAQLKARPGTEFTLIKRPLHLAVAQVGKQLSVSEKGSKTGIISLSLTSPDPVVVSSLLDAIAKVYVEQNVKRDTKEAESSLQFLEKQLPPLKENLDAAENAYNQFRVKNSSINFDEETKTVLLNMNSVDASLLQLQQERNEARKRFKPKHPTIKALDGKIAILKQESKRLEKNTNAMPDQQKEIIRLAREVEMNTILYSKLLSKSQELRVAKAGTVGSVRVVDQSFVPLEPVKPNKNLILLLGFCASLVFGVILAFIRRIFSGGVDDPDELERKLDVPIYGSVTHSKEQSLALKHTTKNGRPKYGILAQNYPESVTVECLRSLRTSLHFCLQNASNNIVLVSGSSSGIGKTFTSINLGAILAESGKHVLVIDGDLRRGTLHKYIGSSRDNGLADFITNPTLQPTQLVKDTDISNLKVLTSGKLPASSAALLLHNSFQEMLELFSGIYDYIIIDGPPILSVTDSAIIGKHAGTTLMVIKSDYHQMKELEQAHKQFDQAGIEVKGLILNGIRKSASSKGYGRYVYRYEYQKG